MQMGRQNRSGNPVILKERLLHTQREKNKNKNNTHTHRVSKPGSSPSQSVSKFPSFSFVQLEF